MIIETEVKFVDETITKALAAFAEYATLDASKVAPLEAREGEPEPDMPAVRRAQILLAAWSRRNFPMGAQTHDLVCGLGVVEELSELVGHLLAVALGKGNGFLTEAQISDALADMMIYACQIATTYRLDYLTLVEASRPASVLVTPHGLPMRIDAPSAGIMGALAVGRLARALGKSAAGIRGLDTRENQRHAIAAAIMSCANFAQTGLQIMKAQPDTMFVATARRVMQRDWIAYPMTGDPPRQNAPTSEVPQ